MTRLAELQQAGAVDRFLLKADRSGAILLLHAPDHAAAQACIDSLPLISHAVTRFTLTEVITPPGRSPS
jgi:hypothetical protein